MKPGRDEELIAQRKDDKKEWRVAKILLSKAVRLAPMSQTKFKVVKNAAGLILLEPRADIVPKYKVREANGVAEVLPENPFEIFLFNFGDHERRFTKVMVFAYATKHPLALVPVIGEARREVARCLNILEDTEAVTDEEVEDPCRRSKIHVRKRR